MKNRFKVLEYAFGRDSETLPLGSHTLVDLPIREAVYRMNRQGNKGKTNNGLLLFNPCLHVVKFHSKRLFFIFRVSHSVIGSLLDLLVISFN